MIRALTAAEAERHAPALGALLRACVEDGASFGFVMPFAQAEAEAFWTQSVLPALGRDDRVLWAAFEDDALVGTVQLVLGMMPALAFFEAGLLRSVGGIAPHTRSAALVCA